MSKTWGPPPQPPPTPQPQWGQTPPAPPRKKRSAWQIILLVIVGLFVIGSISNALTGGDTTGTSATSPAQTEAADSGISQGLGTKDASADVELLSFKATGTFDEVVGKIRITNHSDGISDYYIEVAIEDANGTNVDWSNAVAQHVRPNQKAVVEFSTFNEDAAKAVITEVQRTSSS